ncbi:MAG TPA: hypothetical protein VEG38_11685 [Acidimicrobiia bacterium]|nr:hypothetical protein [Acidimicrobiia bacterium]
MGRFLTAETIRLGLYGCGCGCAVGFLWRAAGRLKWGAAPFIIAVLVAARLADRSDWPRWDGMAAVGILIMLLAGLGGARLLASVSAHWLWVAAGSLVSAAGVWAGVPETGPVLLSAGGVAGLAATAALTGARWAPTAGVGLAAVIGWAALSGAVGRPWAIVGGALCSGVAPSFVLPRLHRALPRTWTAGPWLLAVHMVLVVCAARWIGVTPEAGWERVAVLGAVGLAVAAVTRRA